MKQNKKLSKLKCEFDEKIKQMILAGEENVLYGFEMPCDKDFGRKTKNWGCQKNYFNEAFGKKILKSIENIVKPEDYKGDEMEDKFFSSASSSRFALSSFLTMDDDKCYKVIDSIGDFKIHSVAFEKDCPVIFEGETIDKVHSPQLDVYFVSENGENWYIEAKCHENFTPHYFLELKPKYRGFLEKYINPYLKIHNISDKTISIEKKGCEDGQSEIFLAAQDNDSFRMLKSEDFGVERKTAHFDFKQFLCHLMGIISTEIAVPKENRKLKHFYYLFYKIRDSEFDWIYEELEAEINAVYNAFKNIFDEYKIDFGYCYNDHFSALKSLKNELKF